MNDRQLIADLLSALEYHTEQTRPIQFSKVAIEAAREYLRKPAQQPAQQQEPVACKTLCELCIKRGYIFCANAAQTTPIPSPPASKPWVGLTDEEIALIDWESLKTKKNCVFAIEAKLREKNA